MPLCFTESSMLSYIFFNKWQTEPIEHMHAVSMVFILSDLGHQQRLFI